MTLGYVLKCNYDLPHNASDYTQEYVRYAETASRRVASRKKRDLPAQGIYTRNTKCMYIRARITHLTEMLHIDINLFGLDKNTIISINIKRRYENFITLCSPHPLSRSTAYKIRTNIISKLNEHSIKFAKICYCVCFYYFLFRSHNLQLTI